MDGLLIDSEPFWRNAQRKAFKTVGITPTTKDFQHTMGTGITEVVQYWHHRQPWEGPSQKDIEALVVDELLRQVREEGKALPGVVATLQLCQKQDVKMALASSSSMEIIDTVLDKLQIREYFDHVQSAEHEPYGKPHPGVFLTTAGFLQVPAHQCMVFEDSPSGVLAAKAAKMHCIAVPDSAAKDHRFIQTADIILDSLKDFDHNTFERLN